MPMTSCKWGSKAFQSLLFKNDKDEKHHSSSIELKTWTIAIFVSLMYLGKVWQST
jgi:hypothetical protein